MWPMIPRKNPGDLPDRSRGRRIPGIHSRQRCTSAGVSQLRSVDTAVIDNIMHDMTGVDLAREIKSSAPGAFVVMYSGE